MNLLLCHVCNDPVEVDANGEVRYEGTRWNGSGRWVWGPHPVHEGCRLFYIGPFTDAAEDTTATWFMSPPLASGLS